MVGENLVVKSSDMEGQDFQIQRGDRLSSGSSDYMVLDFLGEGSFGKVTRCVELDTYKTVAIKIMKKRQQAMRDAQLEVSMLKKLRALDPDKCNLVRWNGCFNHRGHFCLEFEMLDISLRDFLKQRGFRGLSLSEIRPIMHQLATALAHLKSAGITHSDLKPDNIMMVDHVWQPLKVKIIDFGSAFETSGARSGSYIQTRWYRSPEVMLGLPYTEAIDVWSLGCVAAELFLGQPLYPGRNEYEMFSHIVRTQGPLPDHLLHCGRRTNMFFCKSSTNRHQWRLKTPAEYYGDNVSWSGETLTQPLRSLEDLQQISGSGRGTSAGNMANDLCRFVAMLKKLLQLDANQRITPRQLLQHPFISMSHLQELIPHRPNVQPCHKMMAVCHQTSDRGNTMSWSTHQPSRPQQASSTTACFARPSNPHQGHAFRHRDPAQAPRQGTNPTATTKRKGSSGGLSVPGQAEHSKPLQAQPSGHRSPAQAPQRGANPHPSCTSKRKRSSPRTLVQSNSVVAPPVYTEGPGSNQTSESQSRPQVKRRRVEEQTGEGPSHQARAEKKRKRADLPCGDDRHSARDTGLPDSKRARMVTKPRSNGAAARAQSTASTYRAESGTLSSVARTWYASFVPELLPSLPSQCSKRANPGPGRAT
ncbi:homeodomain-interacting protein kinase 1-like [Myripristis murdjan]|uniref:homeodomain-interacting protein kinase 1-like n=1 Tax=Myripristis murdjan TaxID=586833 RepID=UPI0011762B8B|nr:homeodomain-interacting protein kinase 1-like [Myripristis murdjan]